MSHEKKSAVTLLENTTPKDTMRAVLLHGVRDLRIERAPKPERAPDEVLLRVRAVGVCGSDLHHCLEGAIGATKSAEPFILGHEFAAEVVEAPEFTPDLIPGTLVAVDPSRPCGACEWCAAGHPNHKARGGWTIAPAGVVLARGFHP